MQAVDFLLRLNVEDRFLRSVVVRPTRRNQVEASPSLDTRPQLTDYFSVSFFCGLGRRARAFTPGVELSAQAAFAGIS